MLVLYSLNAEDVQTRKHIQKNLIQGRLPRPRFYGSHCVYICMYIYV